MTAAPHTPQPVLIRDRLMLDTTLIMATAAGLGSLLGAAASITTTWITQHTQNTRAYAEWRQREREGLYKEFIAEASALTVDALMHSLERPDPIIKLYGVLSRIRLVSGQEVVLHGQACCRRIIEMYGQPNLTMDDLRELVAANRVTELDPLKAFSAACRNELLGSEGGGNEPSPERSPGETLHSFAIREPL
jgi:hypothetical protein